MTKRKIDITTTIDTMIDKGKTKKMAAAEVVVAVIIGVIIGVVFVVAVAAVAVADIVATMIVIIVVVVIGGTRSATTVAGALEATEVIQIVNRLEIAEAEKGTTKTKTKTKRKTETKIEIGSAPVELTAVVRTRINISPNNILCFEFRDRIRFTLTYSSYASGLVEVINW